MIYAKIYLDKNENGEDMLVFDSVKEDSGYRFSCACSRAQEQIKKFGRALACETKVSGVDGVAISDEAKAFFLEILSDKNAYERSHSKWSPADFTMNGCFLEKSGWNNGEFAYCPPNAEQGNTKKTLRKGESFTVSAPFSAMPLEYMTPAANEMLKKLDISAPVDESALSDAYYGALYAKESPATDAQTIRKTPLRYLTEAQKQVIRDDYRALTARYTDQQWYEQGDFLSDKIKGELTEKYLKFNGDLDKILE